MSRKGIESKEKKKDSNFLPVEVTRLSIEFCSIHAYNSIVPLTAHKVDFFTVTANMAKKVLVIKISRKTFLSFNVDHISARFARNEVDREYRLKKGFLFHCISNAVSYTCKNL